MCLQDKGLDYWKQLQGQGDVSLVVNEDTGEVMEFEKPQINRGGRPKKDKEKEIKMEVARQIRNQITNKLLSPIRNKRPKEGFKPQISNFGEWGSSEIVTPIDEIEFSV